MLTSRTAQWVTGTALLCAGLIALSWLFLVSPRRSEAAELRDQNAAAVNQNDLLEVKIAQLKAQFAKLPESQAALADILAQMPPDAGMPRLVRDLDSMADATGVTLSSLTPGAATPLAVDTTAAAAAAAAAPTATAGTGATGATGTGGDKATTVVSIPVTLVVSGDYFQTVAFLKQLQTRMPRAFLVTTVQMAAGSTTGSDSAAGTTSGQVQVTINGSVFALPGLSADVVTTGQAQATGAAGSPMGAATATAAPSAQATAVPSAGAAPSASPAASPAASAN